VVQPIHLIDVAVPLCALQPVRRGPKCGEFRRVVHGGKHGPWARTRQTRVVIERASTTDLMQRAVDVEDVPTQIAAVLVLEGAADLDPAHLAAVTGRRLARVPRLRQRLRRAPIGCGRPYWTDDPTFDPQGHVDVVACAPPGDEPALLDAAVAVAMRRLPASRPLWAATVVTGLSGNRLALVVVLHHVVADGTGGLAVLGTLVDTGPSSPERSRRPHQPRRPPSGRELAVDAWSARWRAVTDARVWFRQLGKAVQELATTGVPAASRSSLNRPIGSRRALRVARMPLPAALATAHNYGATVNDVVLTATAGALRRLLSSRGETVPQLVISVPTSRRRTTSDLELGNQVGVMPIAVPTGSDPVDRLKSVAAITGRRKRRATGSSGAVVEPVFRALGALGLVGWFIAHQRMINTLVSDVRGPETPMTFLGAPIVDVIPVSDVYGNVPVAFTALSYADTLTVSIMADPGLLPELAELTAQLQDELDALGGSARSG